MAGPATTLREIHRLQRHARDLKSEMDRMPRLLKNQEAKITRQEEAVAEAQNLLKRLKLANVDKESELKSTLQLIEKHKQQREQVSSKKEYDALTHEIAAEKTKCQELEDEILDTMGQIEERTAQ